MEVGLKLFVWRLSEKRLKDGGNVMNCMDRCNKLKNQALNCLSCPRKMPKLRIGPYFPSTCRYK